MCRQSHLINLYRSGNLFVPLLVRRRRVVVGVWVFVYSILISSVPELFFVNFAVHTPKYPHIYYAFMCVLLVRGVALKYLNLSFFLDRKTLRGSEIKIQQDNDLTNLSGGTKTTMMMWMWTLNSLANEKKQRVTGIVKRQSQIRTFSNWTGINNSREEVETCSGIRLTCPRLIACYCECSFFCGIVIFSQLLHFTLW